MQHHQSSILAGCFMMITTLTAIPSATRAESSPGQGHAKQLDRATIETLIGKITVQLREGYVFPDKGALAADALEAAYANNSYADVTDPANFALRLTEQLREITNDSHIRVIFGSPFSNQPSPSAPKDAGFEVKRLNGNIGYIHLSRFAPPEVFNPAADDAIAELTDTAALIIDMRDNGGGHPASVAYLISFLLDPAQRVHINDLIWRNRGTTTFRTESFWSSPTPKTYLGKPVYVLVGPKTYSAGEEFAYDLQVLKRATVVGETTRGGANPGGLNELGSDLYVVVPPGRAQNPITQGNWGGTGVHPDIRSSSDEAQNTALALATAQTTARSSK